MEFKQSQLPCARLQHSTQIFQSSLKKSKIIHTHLHTNKTTYKYMAVWEGKFHFR